MTPEQCRTARQQLGWTIEELEFRSGVGRTAIGSFERGKRIPGAVSLNLLRMTFQHVGIVFDDARSIQNPAARMQA